MITRITSVILSVLLITTQAGQAQSAPRNPKLSQLIDSLRDEDQKPATLEASKAEQAFKAATLRHIPFIKDILKKHGFPGYDLVGKTSSDNFWMLVQHSDADLPLQKQALQLMDKEVKKKNASGDKYAYLIDRIRINEGGKQVYGTQISWTTGAPVPKALENPESVDQRRKEVGMAPLADYLQAALDAHYEMNKNRPLADSLAELVTRESRPDSSLDAARQIQRNVTRRLATLQRQRLQHPPTDPGTNIQSLRLSWLQTGWQRRIKKLLAHGAALRSATRLPGKSPDSHEN
jgi:hypothetical protein